MLGATGNSVPKVDADCAIKLYEAVSKITGQGLANSLHTPALGGLAVAFAKTAMGGRLGLEIDLDSIPSESGMSAQELLFSESNSRFVMTANPANAERLESILEGFSFAKVGEVIPVQELALKSSREDLNIKVSMNEMLDSYKNTLDGI